MSATHTPLSINISLLWSDSPTSSWWQHALLAPGAASARLVRLLEISVKTGQGKTLFFYFEEIEAEIIEFIRWLVEQESMSREAEANRRIAENLAEKLAQRPSFRDTAPPRG